MKEKKDCKIVQDLLPNYIEKLTEEETNQYVEEHLSDCNECKEVYIKMQKDLKIKEEKRDKREIKYMKKYNRKLKVMKNFLLFILVALIIVIVAFFINTFRKFVILSNLKQKAEQYSSVEEYHKKFVGTVLVSSRKDIVTTDLYVKNGKRLEITKFEQEKSSSKVSRYETDGKSIIYYEDQNGEEIKKTVEIKENEMIEIPNYLTIFDIIEMENAWQTFLYSMRLKVEKVTISISNIIEKDYYVISYIYDDKYYIDAETALTYRTLNDKTNTIHEYEFNNVNEEVFIQPNIDEYKVRE